MINNSKKSSETEIVKKNEKKHIRQDLVDTAVRFMMGPKVRQTPIQGQREFLTGKGLTEEEIQLAVDKVAQLDTLDRVVQATPPESQVSAPRNRWLDYTNMLLLFGGVSYGVWNLWRSFIQPRFFPAQEPESASRVETELAEIRDSLRFLMDSVQQTLGVVQQQQAAMNRALGVIGDGSVSQNRASIQELKNELGVIKSLLLNKNQFAPLPVNRSLPQWQLNGQSRDQKPVEDEIFENGKENDDDDHFSSSSETNAEKQKNSDV